MTDRARELLELCLKHLEWVTQFPEGDDMEEVAEEIRAYLAEPEVKREELSDQEIDKQIPEISQGFYGIGFYDGVRFAEKHHGIGGGE